MSKTIREVALDLYKPPFTYEHGYVFDSTHQMVADSGDIGEMRDLLITRIRGWGRIQYMDNPKGRAAALQDEVGQIVVEALNAFWAGEAQAAITTLKDLGYTFRGGVQWKPPLGAAPNFELVDQWRTKAYHLQAEVEALRAQRDTLLRDIHGGEPENGELFFMGYREQVEHLQSQVDELTQRLAVQNPSPVAFGDSIANDAGRHPAIGKLLPNDAPTRPAVPGSEVAVNAGALKMVRNALQRDADEGKQSRREMLAELDATIRPLAAVPQAKKEGA